MEFAGNLVNSDDFAALVRQLRKRPRRLLGKLSPGQRRRVRQAWAHVTSPPVHSWSIPAFRERRTRLATGDSNVTIPEYAARTYLGTGLRGLSLGCGVGSREAAWAATGAFARLECYDLSPDRIRHAQERFPSSSVLSFSVGDAYELRLGPASFDVVIFEDALHHLAPPAILERCKTWLAPGGYLFVNEYVGARKLQYDDRLVETANGMLALLPEELRISHAHGCVKRAVRRPSLLRMRFLDPSEAVEADLIRPTVESMFDVIEDRDLGGSATSLVLEDIAQNFVDGRGAEWLELLFAVEDALLAGGEIESAYAFMVARR